MAQETLPASPLVRATVLLVRGASGEPEYGTNFQTQSDAWQTTASTAGAELLMLGGGSPGGTREEADHSRLEKILTDMPKEGPAPLWIVLIGHGTWDGKEARFNLEGPDLSGSELAAWLRPVKRPLTLINTSSSSGPFISLLAGPGRTVITATRSGSERNYARYGDYLAQALTDPAADYDQDGSVSVLEWFLRASSLTVAFYQADGRLLTEHALIDDNGDGKATPADWFRGLRATSKAKDGTPVDGSTAQRIFLKPDTAAQQMTPVQLALRDDLEAKVNSLRQTKSSLPEADYYHQLEDLLRQLAELYP